MEGVGIIYLAVNSVNGKMYVGKTARELPVRIREHLYDSHNKRNTAFSRAIFKYGIEAFTFTVLETCYDLAELDACETLWIAVYDSHKPRGYNLTDGGDGCLGLKRPDVTARLKAMTGEKNHMFGKKYTEEEKKKFGQPGERNPRYGLKMGVELKALISERVKTAMNKPRMKKKLRDAAWWREATKRQEKRLA